MSEPWPDDPRTRRDDLLCALEDQRTVVVLHGDGEWSVRPLTLAEGEAKVYVGQPEDEDWQLIGTTEAGVTWVPRKRSPLLPE